MHKSKYKHIIWDYNGTLVDDTWLCVEIVNEFLVREGKSPIDEDIYRQKYDLPVIDFYREIGFDLEKTSYHQISTEFIEIYDRRRFECSLQPGIREVLGKIYDGGIPQSVLSAYQQHRLEEALEYYGLTEMFKHIAGLGDYYAHGKVNIGQKLVSSLDCPPIQAVIIGDTTHDYKVARKSGADCILLETGHHTRDKLSTCPVKIIEHPTLITNFLDL